MADKETSLLVEKSFPVSVQVLADAWTSPEKLKQWWKPAGNQLKNVENDLKTGGKILYEFGTQSGQEDLKITGEYQEVQPDKKLVYSWNWDLPTTQAVTDNEFRLTVEFEPEGNGSKLKVTQENFKAQESIHPHQEGWNKALDDLLTFVSR